LETKIEISIDSEGTMHAWWSKQFEELISDMATEEIEEREGGPRPVGDFPFHPEFCG